MQYNSDIYDKKWYRSIGDEDRYALNPRYQEIITLHDTMPCTSTPAKNVFRM